MFSFASELCGITQLACFWKVSTYGTFTYFLGWISLMWICVRTRWHVWAVCWWKMSCPVCQHSRTTFKSSCSSLWQCSSCDYPTFEPFQHISSPYALIEIRHSKYCTHQKRMRWSTANIEDQDTAAHVMNCRLQLWIFVPAHGFPTQNRLSFSGGFHMFSRIPAMELMTRPQLAAPVPVQSAGKRPRPSSNTTQ